MIAPPSSHNASRALGWPEGVCLSGERVMLESTDSRNQEQADAPTKGRPTDEQIQEGFELLRLGQLSRTPFTSPDDFARSFKRCSLFKKERIRVTTGTGV
jgi:hypothetical protein